MAKLNILGAQRVKALIEILHEKKAAEIEKIKASLPTTEQIVEELEKERGVDHLRTLLEAAIQDAREIGERIAKVTGKPVDVRYSFYAPNRYNADEKTYVETYHEWKAEIERRVVESQAPLREIKQTYKDKERRLWLCETLEEAKEIVGIE